ncbi:hypothetical protein K435DRAFT_870947 [Dendrothele bispora CBS 962.96]|uniref:Uncharacterized protein n=1 Tax=Dendrothele bispora (strain CBS 962.96) TaxID=1314807 RepID=A0A4S8L5R1_DENBC|nr:hypothetical protein K435DRAFT_870947 [Dendrothele bispora CBS 962.96]
MGLDQYEQRDVEQLISLERAGRLSKDDKTMLEIYREILAKKYSSRSNTPSNLATPSTPLRRVLSGSDRHNRHTSLTSPLLTPRSRVRPSPSRSSPLKCQPDSLTESESDRSPVRDGSKSLNFASTQCQLESSDHAASQHQPSPLQRLNALSQRSSSRAQSEPLDHTVPPQCQLLSLIGSVTSPLQHLETASRHFSQPPEPCGTAVSPPNQISCSSGVVQAIVDLKECLLQSAEKDRAQQEEATNRIVFCLQQQTEAIERLTGFLEMQNGR